MLGNGSVRALHGFLFFFLALYFCVSTSLRGEARNVRVGIFPAAPLVMPSGQKAAGLFIDILEYVAAQSNWHIEYVKGTWGEHLHSLEVGDLDLLPAVAYTSERTTKYDFNQIPVFIDSGVLFTRPKFALHTIFDLRDKKVAAVKGSIFTTGFINYTASFGVSCDILYTDDNPAVMRALESGQVDAGVCIYSLGTVLSKEYAVTVTPISFTPLALNFAVPKGKNADLIGGIDELLGPMLTDANSMYSKSYKKWTMTTPQKEAPMWLLWGSGGLVGIGLLLGLWTLTLKRQVVRQTRILEEEIVERKQAEETVRQALVEKEALIKELFHRTRNTMQTIQGLIVLQAEELPKEAKLQSLIKNTEIRIQSISLVHQMLFTSQNLSRIPVKEYTEELASILVSGNKISRERISVDIKMDEQFLLIDTAIPYGLIIGELMANSLRHAFPGDRKGRITITLRKKGEHRCLLTFADNGVGAPTGFDFRNASSLGLSLIHSLGEEQMMGNVAFDSIGGVRCSIDFPTEIYQERV